MYSGKTNQAARMKRKMYEMGLWVLAPQAPFPFVFQTSSQFILVCGSLKMAINSLTPPALRGGLCPLSLNLGSLCNYFDEQNAGEGILCWYLRLSLKRLDYLFLEPWEL